MKHIFTPFLIAFSFFIISCSNDDKDEVVISPYAGYYSILSAESDTPLDLDDNGTAGTDLMAEIQYFNRVPYDIFLDERPDGYKSINFYIPYSSIPDDMESFKVGYPHGASGEYYQYVAASNEIIIDTTTASDSRLVWGNAQSVEILDATTLKCKMQKSFYDYQIHDIKTVMLTLVFQKVDL